MFIKNQNPFRALWRCIAVSFVMLLTGCAITPSIPANSYANKLYPYERSEYFWIDQSVTRASFEEINVLSKTDDTTSRLEQPFIGVALSGGGSRAAFFSLAVLKELEQEGILKHVTAISTVSGGSITGAHFALNYTKFGSNYWSFAHKEMLKSFRDRWIGRYFLPWNVGWSLISDYDRTDVLAKVYDNNLFHGATFGDFGTSGPNRPAILINAAKVNNPPFNSSLLSSRLNQGSSSRFSGFTFTMESFSALGSDLSKYPVANAVAASSAFPLVFNPLTLAQFPPNTLETFVSRKKMKPVPMGYLHLIDGGVADNLGVDALITSAQHHFQKRYLLNGDMTNSCLLILVDSDVDRRSFQEGLRRDLRKSMRDYLVDDSAVYAFDTLFARRREETLKSLGINLSQRDGFEYRRAVSEHEVDLGENGWSGTPGALLTNVDQNKSVKSVKCAIWHISLNEIYGLNKKGSLAENQTLDYQNKLWAVANSIKTDLKLTGVGKCSPEFIADRISDSARLLVREDLLSRKTVCEWFGNNKAGTPNICNPPNPVSKRSQFDIYPMNASNNSPATLVTCEQPLEAMQ
ncbi:patatin-like phospholipase family protein [Massilia timonae]|uniref:Patatin-like phospholipase family protein n=2 Tax=Massilia timonae TaxID=47229 RepID=A0A1S2NEP5_9BURK|nr:patatin-like phospholipase family protein [Massilia timonae]